MSNKKIEESTIIWRVSHGTLLEDFTQRGKSLKNSLKECVFVNSAFGTQNTYHVVKNTLLQTAFSAIFPTG